MTILMSREQLGPKLRLLRVDLTMHIKNGEKDSSRLTICMFLWVLPSYFIRYCEEID